jgi:hypothetical protein
VTGAAQGDEPTAGLLGGLFRDPAIAEILDSAARIPATCKGIVLVEGITDAAYAALLATNAGLPEFVEDLHIIPVGGTSRLILEAALLKAQSSLPIITVLDSDEPGRHASRDLKKKLGFRSSEVAFYAELFKGTPEGIEAEDLFPADLLQRFVDAEGEANVLNAKTPSKALQGGLHFDFNALGKQLLPGFLLKNATKEDLEQWGQFVVLVREKLGLPSSK